VRTPPESGLRFLLSESRLSNGQRLFQSGLHFARCLGHLADRWKTGAVPLPEGWTEAKFNSPQSNAALISQVWTLTKPASDDFVVAAMAAVDERLKDEPDKVLAHSIRKKLEAAFQEQPIAYARAKGESAIEIVVDLATVAKAHRGSVVIYVGLLPPLRRKVSALLAHLTHCKSIAVYTDSMNAGAAFWAQFLAANSSGDGQGNQEVVQRARDDEIRVAVTDFSHPTSTIIFRDGEEQSVFSTNFEDEACQGLRVTNADLEAAWLQKADGEVHSRVASVSPLEFGYLGLELIQDEAARIVRSITP
jgi:hypothetical protein